MIQYHLAEQVGKVVVEITDAAGNLVDRSKGRNPNSKPSRNFSWFRMRRSSVPTTGKGLNRFVWNGRYQGAVGFEGMILWSARAASGPKAPPGEYQVRVEAAGVSEETSVTLIADPRLEGVTTADLVEQFELASRIRDRTSHANEAVIQIRDVRLQLEDRLEGTSDQGVIADGGRLIQAMTEVEEALYQTKNRSNQDPLNFPIRLNNRLASLRPERGDRRRQAHGRCLRGVRGAVRRAGCPPRPALQPRGRRARRPEPATHRRRRRPGRSRSLEGIGPTVTPRGTAASGGEPGATRDRIIATARTTRPGAAVRPAPDRRTGRCARPASDAAP